ncbi:MAG TPA: hypothetical protein DD738_00870, partial [Ruminiclostridium sp.]|nr:hypothetical protein [Ruminiclostridium sp.]
MNVEYVPEYAKELVWEGNLSELQDQRSLFEIQSSRIDRLLGKVDVVVTDSPVLLNAIYDPQHDQKLYAEVIKKHREHNTLNLFVQRGSEFQQAGRIHDLSQSQEIDRGIQSLLTQENVPFETVTHADYLQAVQDVQPNNQVQKEGQHAQTQEERDAFSLGRRSAQEIMRAGYQPFYDKGNLHIFQNPETGGFQFYAVS